MIVINDKSFLENLFLQDFNQQLSNIYFLEEKLYCLNPLGCTSKLVKIYKAYLVLMRKWLRNGISGRSN